MTLLCQWVTATTESWLLLKTEGKCRDEFAALWSGCVWGFSSEVFLTSRFVGLIAVVPQWVSLMPNTIGLHLWSWQGAQLSCTTITATLWSFLILAMGSQCPLCLSVQGWGKICSWRAVRNIFIKIIQAEPSLAPSTASQGLRKQRKSDRNSLKRKMKPRRGRWLNSLSQRTSRKPGKGAEMQIFPGEAGPGVRRPLNPLHLSLPICSRSSGSAT